MDADRVWEAAQATVSGALPFPEIIGRLMADGVESYQVDFAARCFRFYSAAGGVAVAALTLPDLPAVASDWDAPALRAAIVDSQQQGQKFAVFCQRAVAAGVLNYAVYLRGQRVVYSGRLGDQHTEWFPGAAPAA